MAEEIDKVEPIAAVPPQVNPFAPKPEPAAEKPAAPAPKAETPAKPSAAVALKPGLKLPTQTALKPGLKLPPKPGATVALKPGLKLPPKPGATVALKPGLKLPTQTALKPGLKLPTKPVIRKPGSTVVAAPIPKPITGAASQPAPEKKPTVAAKPVAVDAQGVGKLPTVATQAVDRNDTTPVVSENPKPLEQLKSVTQKLKGITQEIPQQAILRKTGIIAEGAMSEAQKEAAKHKTARISLSDAMGVAPVKNENAPMKTIRIKRPIDIPGATAPLAPQPKPEAPGETPAAEKPATETTSASTITQRKTLKIARPGGGAVRPSGKFGVKRPSQATTVAAKKSDGAAVASAADGAVADVADIADIPSMPPVPTPVAPVSDGPAWLWALSTVVQAAACVVMGALAWYLYQNTQTMYF